MNVTANGPGKPTLTGVDWINLTASGPLEQELLKRLLASMQTSEGRRGLFKYLERYKDIEIKRAGP